MFASLRRTSRRARIILASALIAIGIGGGVLATGGVAHASGMSCARWGSLTIPGENLTIPSGQYCFSVSGSGLTVYNTQGSEYTGWIYNYGETIRFYNNSGQNYFTYSIPTHLGWAYGWKLWTTGINGRAQAGRACGTLTSAGAEVATTCVGIYP